MPPYQPLTTEPPRTSSKPSRRDSQNDTKSVESAEPESESTESTESTECARKRLYAIQKQWVINAKPDIENRKFSAVPAISPKVTSIGARKDITDQMLIPSDIWLLRSLSPTKRLIAYTHMAKLARRMIQYDQISDEYQDIWSNITRLRATLFQNEQAWVARSKKGTDEEKVAHLSSVLREQSVQTTITQLMIQELQEFEKRNPWSITNGYQDFVDGPSPDEKTPTEQAARKKPTIIRKAQRDDCEKSYPNPAETISPDKVKHPLDQVAVPEYPLDSIFDYTPHPDTKRYKCRHPFDTGRSCCRDGLNRKQMLASISKDLSTWRGKVERLIQKGQLHPSHRTWNRDYGKNNRFGHNEQEKSVAKRKAEEEQQEEEGPRKRSKTGGEQTKKVTQEMKKTKAKEQGDKKTLEVGTLVAKESDTWSACTHNERAAQGAHGKEIEAALKKYDREYRYCRRIESMKKYPDWERFDNWWNIKHLQVQGMSLSAEQRDVLGRGEPYGIPDRNPEISKNAKKTVFAGKTTERGAEGEMGESEQTAAVQGEDGVEAFDDDDGLNDLFEDCEEEEEEGDGLDHLFEEDGEGL
ncbi:uncharacterized protein SETTUDRAFT_99395 [Exserohilum turcica Et28A]|uniref:Uncharacterized protein n=1 Tax=Exserohilum turcicum (strain 28A) TaxID=671987 RepID=R0JZY7_EXST2|nr:uncharacterized protein SETTUDRAFT_99395 [Exserohilum turcica Et28A]EOA81767.1 hypothetical protein SETTUDRAFT_99395 [Exserohilum turcica Et28A]